MTTVQAIDVQTNIDAPVNANIDAPVNANIDENTNLQTTTTTTGPSFSFSIGPQNKEDEVDKLFDAETSLKPLLDETVSAPTDEKSSEPITTTTTTTSGFWLKYGDSSKRSEEEKTKGEQLDLGKYIFGPLAILSFWIVVYLNLISIVPKIVSMISSWTSLIMTNFCATNLKFFVVTDFMTFATYQIILWTMGYILAKHYEVSEGNVLQFMVVSTFLTPISYLLEFYDFCFSCCCYCFAIMIICLEEIPCGMIFFGLNEFIIEFEEQLPIVTNFFKKYGVFVGFSLNWVVICLLITFIEKFSFFFLVHTSLVSIRAMFKTNGQVFGYE